MLVFRNGNCTFSKHQIKCLSGFVHVVEFKAYMKILYYVCAHFY